MSKQVKPDSNKGDAVVTGERLSKQELAKARKEIKAETPKASEFRVRMTLTFSEPVTAEIAREFVKDLRGEQPDGVTMTSRVTRVKAVQE